MDDTNNGVETLLYLLRQRLQNAGNLQELIKKLVDEGSLLDEENSVGVTVLHSAIAKGLKEDVNLLLGRGSDLSNCFNHCGNTPLHVAANTDYIDIIDLLLERGAEVNKYRKSDKYTPLHIAVLSGQVKATKKLLDYGADVTLRNLYGNTALHLACGMGYKNIAQILLERVTDLEAKNNIGNTPLANAGRNDHGEVVELLLSKGADPNIKYSKQGSLLSTMMSEELPYIAIQLIRYGAHVPNFSFVKSWQLRRGNNMSEKEMLVFLAVLLSGNDPGVIRQMLRDHWMRNCRYPGELQTWLNANANGPLQLRMQCRQKVRQRIMAQHKNNFGHSLRRLPLPAPMIEFLMLSDLCFLKKPLRIVFKSEQKGIRSSGAIDVLGLGLAIDTDS